jgi:potassium efflux system protein
VWATPVRDYDRCELLVLADPESSVTFDEFGDSSLLISLRYFLANIDRPLAIASELRLEINHRFNEVGIEIAFP